MRSYAGREDWYRRPVAIATATPRLWAKATVCATESLMQFDSSTIVPSRSSTSKRISRAVFEGTVRTVETLRFLFSLIDDSQSEAAFTPCSTKAYSEVLRSPISKCCLQVFPRPGKAGKLSRSIPLQVFFEIPGCADTVCGKDQILKLACSGVIEAGKMIGGDFKMISQCVANRVRQ